MSQVVLLLGGNIGDRLNYLSLARMELEKVFPFKQTSSIYETAAWGGNSKQPYLNQLIIVETETSPESVLDKTQEIELRLNRTREVKWGDRTMDIDLIYYDDLIINTDRLKLPHPLLQERRFLLIPLLEVLPDFVHPILGKNTRELLAECIDEGKVSKLIP
ncbi:2-amino-4-hydroxy-6-hydroxymethyldihydropteridine diphosphokinase [Litoribacter populi]|uniref:2-amino-4-hydroxy-6- hydroxymethyldihydropteridine diphosphokinase n=1 Tax=Litoribacter populi TaxID=2598460 RepID=UPI00117F43C8|nr:2-amino-4-hydroxy-6-hydroxymethyldihydropteridine diphosphokinase [Litoribacter populi]